MKKPSIRAKHGPEFHIQKEIVKFLQARGWHVERLVGNAYQAGLPDLYISHRKFGQRWLEIKNSGHYEFTKQQKIKFPILDSYNVGIWIMTGATEEEYDKIFDAPNWRCYWKDSYGQIDIDTLLDDLNELDD